MKKTLKILSLCAAGVLTMSMFTACGGNDSGSGNNTVEAKNQYADSSTDLIQFQDPKSGSEIATLETTEGNIKIMFFPEEAPKAVENFLTHAKEGYYNGVIFHRVINEFMTQTGDPQGTGLGGESIFGKEFGLELSTKLNHFRGAVSMARTMDPESQGSQFFIVQANPTSNMTSDDYWTQAGDYVNQSRQSSGLDTIDASTIFTDKVKEMYAKVGGYPTLDQNYTVFGQVIEGMDVVDKIAAAEVDSNDKPTKDIVINKITVETVK